MKKIRDWYTEYWYIGVPLSLALGLAIGRILRAATG